MAIITNTYETYDATNIPEEVNNKIWRIAREETPIYSSAKKEKTRSKTPEWQTQALASAATNTHAEGDAFAFDARTPTVRVKNHCPDFTKGRVIDGYSASGGSLQHRIQRVQVSKDACGD
jgi:hypothetical protein